MADPQTIKARLESLVSEGSPERLLALFVEELNFNPVSQDILPILSERLKEGVQSMRLIAKQDEFQMVLCVIDRLLIGKERPIAENIAGRYPHSLVVFANPEHSEWHFTNIKYVRFEKEGFERKVRPFRRIIVGSAERLRTASDRLAQLEVGEEDSAITVHERCNRAFDVQEVSREFYRDFVYYYKTFRDALKGNNRITAEQADTLTQNIFNRLIFLYYIQKKNLLCENPTYLYDNFRQSEVKIKLPHPLPDPPLEGEGNLFPLHQGEGKGEGGVNQSNLESAGNYYRDFLLPLFRKLSDPEFRDERLGDIPFLNGGLFEFDPLEEKVTVPNDVFKAVFEYLLERYNFTVREDTEFEQEVAIDPEMLGTIFEQLILSLEKAEFKDIPDARRQTGSYYTPKFIVAFMVKQSLLNYLAEAFPEKREELKELVFSLETVGLAKDELKEIKGRLLDIKIIDPGVGSGAFPVGILLKMVEITEAIDGVIAPEEVRKPKYRYELKLRIIENNIYGVDIQQRAVNLANLRLWLSLIVDLSAKSAKEVLPLPNLDYHIIRGDSLVSKIGEIDFDIERTVRLDAKGTELMDRAIKLKREYEGLPSKEKKAAQKEKIGKAKKELLVWLLKRMIEEKEKKLFNITRGKFSFIKDETLFTKQEEKDKERLTEEIHGLKQQVDNVDSLLSAFNWGLDFFEVLEMRQGFDIVIGNPPYGVKVSDSVKNAFGLGNKDSYGVFTALGLKILRPGGTLCYIMSDTWQTIKTHKPLRDKLISEADCQHIISCPSDTFGATVNVGVYTFKKRLVPKEGGENWILAADFSPLDIAKGEVEAAFEILTEQDISPSPQPHPLPDPPLEREGNKFPLTKGEGQGEGGVKEGDGPTILSDRDMAIFAYKQKLIPRFSNHSFFIASPKLFGLMTDVGNVRNSINVNEPPIYTVEFNGKEMELLKLGDISQTLGGVMTSDNQTFLGLREGASFSSQTYNVIPDDLIVKRSLTEKEKQFGIDTKKNVEHYVWLDKGGVAVDEGIFSNYFVQTDFLVDWSKESVARLQENNGLRNQEHYFKFGIVYSEAGIYSPTFRLSCGQVFAKASPCIFINESYGCTTEFLGLLCASLSRYLFKNFVNHSVHTVMSDIGEFVFPSAFNGFSEAGIDKLVKQTISNQKSNPRYDYMTNEQVEIDRLVYQMYNLDEEDVKEVEDWFFRRYPRLARVIEGKRKGCADQCTKIN